jgi:Pentapeptide repeats (8 copies)
VSSIQSRVLTWFKEKFSKIYAWSPGLFVAVVIVAIVTVILVNTQWLPNMVDLISVVVLGVLLALGCLFAFPYARIWTASGSDDFTVSNGIRTMLVSVVAGAFAMTTLYFSYASAQASAKSAESSRRLAVEQTEATRIGEVNQAIGLLASTESAKQMAGLYLLDELLTNRKSIDQRFGYKLLTLYIRSHTRWDSKQHIEWATASDERKAAAENSPIIGNGSLRKREPTIQFALDLLGKEPKLKLRDGRPFRGDLRDVDLQGAEFGHDQLQGVLFSGAHLDFMDSRTNNSYANFQGADFQGASLFGADLNHATLTNAVFSTPINADRTRRRSQMTNLTRVHFGDANLDGAKLQAAILKQADLSRASLIKADLQEADLTGAHLEGANLTGAKLDDAILEGVSYDRSTKWPDGFYAPLDQHILPHWLTS